MDYEIRFYCFTLLIFRWLNKVGGYYSDFREDTPL